MLFFDTYALIEIIKGSPNYRQYAKEQFITTKYNLMEIYYSLLRLLSEEIAEHYYSLFLPACVAVSDATIKAAMKFRLEQRKHGNLISHIDCIGYFAALESNVKLVTGEKHFKQMDNVEFVE